MRIVQNNNFTLELYAQRQFSVSEERKFQIVPFTNFNFEAILYHDFFLLHKDEFLHYVNVSFAGIPPQILPPLT